MSVPAQDLRTIPAPVRELGSGPPFPEGGGPSAPTSGEPDWRSLFERERRRAEEWRRGEIDWRAKARSWRRQFEIGRDKLTAARAEVREVRRAAREALSLRAEVGRLKRLLAAAGVDARKRSTIVSLRLEVETRRTRIGELEAELAKLRASRAVHAKARFGRKSERRERAGSDRPRGQQAGAAGHGRTPRPGLEKRAEVHNPAADERVCSDCGKPYVANGSDTSELIEVSVKAHTRVIERPRWRRGCDCAAAPPEVSAPPVARLFANTPYGTSVWARFLYERHACLRPLNRVADWLTGQGLAISAGTLADGARRLAPLFEPLSAAIPAHQREARLRQGDDEVEAQSARDPGDCLDDVRVSVNALNAANKAVIKLQRVDGKAAQMAQGRVAATEVVDNDAHAAPAQVVELRHRRLDVACQRLLRDFERHGVGRHPPCPVDPVALKSSSICCTKSPPSIWCGDAFTER